MNIVIVYWVFLSGLPKMESRKKNVSYILFLFIFFFNTFLVLRKIVYSCKLDICSRIMLLFFFLLFMVSLGILQIYLNNRKNIKFSEYMEYHVIFFFASKQTDL